MIDLLKKFYWDMSYAQYRDTYIAALIRNIPGSFGILLRRKWYSKRFKKVGRNLNILPGTYIINPQNVECGDDVSIGVYNYIQAGGGVKIGSCTLLGPFVKIWTQQHNYKDPNTPIRLQGYNFKPVELGYDVWIAANVFIMPGAKIGNKCIISASTVVGAKTYPDGIILAGYPARKIGERKHTEQI